MPNLKKNWKEYLTVFFIFIFFVLHSSYISYPDEFVNILGGSYIDKGLLPYRDFFDHHLPFAWYFASILLPLSFNSFKLFRLFWAIFSFASLFILSRWIKKKHSPLYPYFLAFFFLYPLMGVYFWFHLYIADSLAVLFFSLVFWILLAETLDKKTGLKTLIVSSFLVFLMIFSSLTFAYLALALYVWHAFLLDLKINKNMLKLVSASVAPYLLYLLYLFATGTFKDFYFSNFSYNTELYISIPNYVRGRFFNPIKFGLTLIYNFLSGYLPLLTKIKYLDLYLPVGVLAGFASFILVLLLSEKNLLLGGIFFLVLSFSAPRSLLKTFNETDYQGSLFLMLGLASSLVVVFLLEKIKRSEDVFYDVKRISRFVIMVLIIFSGVFLIGDSYNKLYLRYTQKLPSIYDSSYTAQFLDEILDEGDYFFIGPYEPHEEFYVTKGRLPGKYITLLPQFRENEKTKKDFINQFEKNRPKIIIYKHEASVFNTPSLEFGRFFVDWMSDKYTSLEQVENMNVIRNLPFVNLRTDLYLSNKDKDNILVKLKNKGYIDITAASKTKR